MIKKIDLAIGHLMSYTIYNKGLAFARSSLAMSTLLTLIFNSPYKLFNPVIRKMNGELVFKDSIFEKINIFKYFYEAYPWAANLIAICVLLLVISGYFPRISGILHFWISYSFLTSAALIDGGDQINSNLCLLLIPITMLDYRINHWQDYKKASSSYISIVSNITFLLISLQISMIYFQAGVSKFKVDEWSNGTAVYYWLVDPTFGLNKFQMSIMHSIVTNKIAITIISWGTLLTEIVLFSAILIRHKYYKTIFWIGVSLHFAFLIFIGLFSFFFTMLGALILYLYIPWINYKKNAP